MRIRNQPAAFHQLHKDFFADRQSIVPSRTKLLLAFDVFVLSEVLGRSPDREMYHAPSSAAFVSPRKSRWAALGGLSSF